MRLLLLLALLLGGCASTLVDRLNARGVSSCVWWSGPGGYARGVSATGSTAVAECLSVPCPCAVGR